MPELSTHPRVKHLAAYTALSAAGIALTLTACSAARSATPASAVVTSAAGVPTSAATPSAGGSPTVGGVPAGSYVALGDSYTAGPDIPDQTGATVGCEQSDASYPYLVGRSLRLTLTDMSCGGATIADLSAAQPTGDGTNPAQLSALSAATALVTVGIGGNWSTTVTLSGDGAHSIVAQDTDAAGHTGTSAPVM